MAPNKTVEMNPLTGSPYSKKYYKLLEKRKMLPVWEKKGDILGALAKNQVVIVSAYPGTGKSTQIPQFVVEAGYLSGDKKIACTQPRRIVTTCISCRVADEMDVKIGEQVGYSVRFEECSSPKTILKYLTDGMLFREAFSDTYLDRYRVIILDEAHLRTMATDILLGYLKRLLRVRLDMKLIVMCLPSYSENFKNYFSTAKVVKVPSKLPTVDIFHLQEQVSDYIQAVVDRVLQIHEAEPAGDILVFLAGEDDIRNCSWRIAHAITAMGDRVGPVNLVHVHSALSLEMQKKIFKGPPPPKKKGGPAGRRILLSTDIAECSLAIDGIVYMIDSGFTKQKVYNPNLNIESLLILPASRASAYQRSRCSRSQPGKCFRLYTERHYLDNVQQVISPEITRANLTSAILGMKKLSVTDIHMLDLMDPPSVDAITRAVETLKYLGAVDSEGNLTKEGTLMTEFPLDPEMSKMVIRSPEFLCSNEILSIVAMLSVPNWSLRPTENLIAADEATKKFQHVNGDHLTLLNVYHAYKKCNGDPDWCKQNFINLNSLKDADNVRKQLAYAMCRLGLDLCSTDFASCNYNDNIRKAILSGYFNCIAQLDHSGQYLTVKDHHIVDLHSSCCLDTKPTWVIYNDFVLASRNFIRIVTDICEEWLTDIAPHCYGSTRITRGE